MTHYFLSESCAKQLFHVLVCLATLTHSILSCCTLIFLSWLAVTGVIMCNLGEGSNLVLKGYSMWQWLL